MSKERIKELRKELEDLEKQETKEAIQEYQNLVGSYFMVSPKEVLRIDRIKGFRGNYLGIRCLHIEIDEEDYFSISTFIDYSLDLKVLEVGKINKQRFINFAEKAFNTIKEKL